MKKLLFSLAVLAVSVFTFVTPASANHSWGGYHWARSANPFTLQLGDNLTTSTWKTSLGTASTDWSQSTVMDTTVVPGQSSGNCKATTGRVEVCNKAYGKNGWLGLAQIYLSGSHITKGTTKVNDTYFSTPTYNTTAWKNLVMCQEVGHNFGLDHQDENFNNANLGTCMDYTNNPETNQHPNQHDYQQLETIYAHLDSFTTVSAALTTVNHGQDVGEDPASWGQLVRRSERGAVYERDFGNGQKLLTHVFYAE